MEPCHGISCHVYFHVSCHLNISILYDLKLSDVIIIIRYVRQVVFLGRYLELASSGHLAPDISDKLATNCGVSSRDTA